MELDKKYFRRLNGSLSGREIHGNQDYISGSNIHNTAYQYGSVSSTNISQLNKIQISLPP